MGGSVRRNGHHTVNKRDSLQRVMTRIIDWSPPASSCQ